MLHRFLLPAILLLSSFSALADDFYVEVRYRLTDGNYDRKSVSKRDFETPDARVPLPALGAGSWMEAREDHCILHLAGASFNGTISSQGKLEIQLEGENGISRLADDSWVSQVIKAEALTIKGPGSLVIWQSGGGDAVSTGRLTIEDVGSLDVVAADGNGKSRSDASCISAYTSVSIVRSAVRLRDYCTGGAYPSSGSGIYCVDFEARSSSVSVLSTGAGIFVNTWSTPKAATGAFRAVNSSLHVLSFKDSAGIIYEATRDQAEFSVKDSVLCVHGNTGVSIRRGGNPGNAVAEFRHVSGIVTGKAAGIRCDAPLTFFNTKMLVAGNLYGKEKAEWYGDYAPAALFMGRRGETFVHEGSDTTFLAPGVPAVQVQGFAMRGGEAKVAASVTRQDLLDIWSMDFANREMRALTGVALGAPATTLLTDGHGVFNMAAHAIFMDNALLFDRKLGIPSIGIRSQSIEISGGRLAIEDAAEAGIHLCWPRENDGLLSVTGGTLDVRGQAAALQGYRLWSDFLKAYPSTTKDEAVGFVLSSGTATFKGGKNGILLNSEIRQTAGSLTVGVDGSPTEIKSLDAYPWCSGCALFARDGFAKTGGSFEAASGVVKTDH